jgi:hypothetical protein
VSGSTTVTGTVDREVHMLVPRRWPSPAKPDADTLLAVATMHDGYIRRS